MDRGFQHALIMSLMRTRSKYGRERSAIRPIPLPLPPLITTYLGPFSLPPSLALFMLYGCPMIMVRALNFKWDNCLSLDQVEVQNLDICRAKFSQTDLLKSGAFLYSQPSVYWTNWGDVCPLIAVA